MEERVSYVGIGIALWYYNSAIKNGHTVAAVNFHSDEIPQIEKFGDIRVGDSGKFSGLEVQLSDDDWIPLSIEEDLPSAALLIE
jgi:hypothetical protein